LPYRTRQPYSPTISNAYDRDERRSSVEFVGYRGTYQPSAPARGRSTTYRRRDPFEYDRQDELVDWDGDSDQDVCFDHDGGGTTGIHHRFVHHRRSSYHRIDGDGIIGPEDHST
jgi:hypothetical protein